MDELLDLLGKYEEHQPLTAKDEFGKLPLHHAAEANPHVGSVKLLIDRNNAALSEKCDLEMLPIHWAWCVRFFRAFCLLSTAASSLVALFVSAVSTIRTYA